MLAVTSSRKITVAFASALLVASTFLSTSATAQNNNLDRRVERLEAEVRAVQRKVFPGGSDRFFEPEIQNEADSQPQNTSNASPILADLLARVDALEAQLAGLTAQGEENSFRLGQIENRLQAVETNEKAREEAKVAEPAAANTLSDATPGAAASEPSRERIAAVSAIIKPESANPGEDDYIYGFRLWEAGFFPEAQQQLRLTLEKHPDHARNSHARNLLGRALLDGGKPQSAAQILLENYQANPRGARAPDSLYFLGAALIAAKDNEKACAAFDELAEAYPDTASGRLANRLSSGRETAGCS